MSWLCLYVPYEGRPPVVARANSRIRFDERTGRWEVADSQTGREILLAAGLMGEPLHASGVGVAPPPLPPFDQNGLTVAKNAFARVLADAGAAPATAKVYCSALERWARWWRRPLVEPTTQNLLDYLSFCERERHYGRESINQVVSALRAYYGRVLRWPPEALHLPRPSRVRNATDAYSREDAQLLLSVVCNIKHRTLLTMIYLLRLRKEEVQQLKVDDLDLATGTLRMAGSTAGEERCLTLPPELRQLLVRYLGKHQPRRRLFEGRAGEPYSASSIQTVFTRARAASGLSAGLTLLGLRRCGV